MAPRSSLMSSWRVILQCHQNTVMMSNKQSHWWLSVRILEVARFDALSLAVLSSIRRPKRWSCKSAMHPPNEVRPYPWKSSRQNTKISIWRRTLWDSEALWETWPHPARTTNEWATNSTRALDRAPTRQWRRKSNATSAILRSASVSMPTTNNLHRSIRPMVVLVWSQMFHLKMRHLLLGSEIWKTAAISPHWTRPMWPSLCSQRTHCSFQVSRMEPTTLLDPWVACLLPSLVKDWSRLFRSMAILRALGSKLFKILDNREVRLI